MDRTPHYARQCPITEQIDGPFHQGAYDLSRRQVTTDGYRQT